MIKLAGRMPSGSASDSESWGSELEPHTRRFESLNMTHSLFHTTETVTLNGYAK